LHGAMHPAERSEYLLPKAAWLPEWADQQLCVAEDEWLCTTFLMPWNPPSGFRWKSYTMCDYKFSQPQCLFSFFKSKPWMWVLSLPQFCVWKKNFRMGFVSSASVASVLGGTSPLVTVSNLKDNAISTDTSKGYLLTWANMTTSWGMGQ
jgi:hypothetical protein